MILSRTIERGYIIFDQQLSTYRGSWAHAQHEPVTITELHVKEKENERSKSDRLKTGKPFDPRSKITIALKAEKSLLVNFLSSHNFRDHFDTSLYHYTA